MVALMFFFKLLPFSVFFLSFSEDGAFPFGGAGLLHQEEHGSGCLDFSRLLIPVIIRPERVKWQLVFLPCFLLRGIVKDSNFRFLFWPLFTRKVFALLLNVAAASPGDSSIRAWKWVR